MIDADAPMHSTPRNHNVEIPLFTDHEFNKISRILRLTAKQELILKSLLEGQTDRHIAKELKITLPTVRFHIQKLFRQCGAQDRLGLIVSVFRTFRIRVDR